MTIEIADIAAAIHETVPGTVPPGVRVVDLAPNPYISPEFEVAGNLASEVIIIKAQAAVGKTITAEYLSATTKARLLDLANIEVGAYSLRGAVDEGLFHHGQCPIIVDALDEGAVVSSDAACDRFLFTSRDFLLSNRDTLDKVKVVFLGRPASAQWVQEVLTEHDSRDEDARERPDYKPISICVIKVLFFREEAAKDLVKVYQKNEVDRLFEEQQIKQTDAENLRRQIDSPSMASLYDAYFSQLDAALQLPGGLWNHSVGQAFAGYAPTLAALGQLLARVTNPHKETERLGQGAHSAWGIIDDVIRRILTREREEKIIPAVMANAPAGSRIPPDAYSEAEQFEYLTQAISTGPYAVNLTTRIQEKFQGQSQALREYGEAVRLQLPEHPFLKDGEAANDVLGARILAGAICASSDALEEAVRRREGNLRDFLARASRQPFLWRFIQSEIERSETALLLEGVYLGYIVNSRLNDPSRRGAEKLVLRERPGEGVPEVEVCFGTFEFSVVPPVRLYDQVADATMQCENTAVEIVGRGRSRFTFLGENEVVVQSLHFECDGIGVNAGGSLWLDPRGDGSRWPDTFGIDVPSSAEVGWGSKLAGAYPWVSQESELSDPAAMSMALRLVRRLRRVDFVVLEDREPPEDDAAMQSIAGSCSEYWQDFVTELVGLEGVEQRRFDASGSVRKYRIVGVPWDELEAVCGRAAAERVVPDKWEKFVAKFRVLFRARSR